MPWIAKDGRNTGSLEVRLGSLADIRERISDVRFAPESGHVSHELDVCFVPLADIGGSLGACLRQAECGPGGDWTPCAPLATLCPSVHSFRSPSYREVAIRSSAVDTTPVRSKPTHEKKYDEDDQDDADDTDAAVTEAVAVAAEATTEATKQEDDEEDDEYESDGHDLSPVAALTEH